MSRAIVLFSGGKDSTIALWWAIDRFDQVVALSIEYPERPRAEARAAAEIAQQARVSVIEGSLPDLQSVRRIKRHGEPTHDTGSAYIPMRNILFLSLASYFAERIGCNAVVSGQLRSDAVAYSDAHPDFIQKFASLASESLSRSYLTGPKALDFFTPLAEMPDAEAIDLGVRLGAPIARSWSCLEDVDRPCGTCVSCKDRQALL